MTQSVYDAGFPACLVSVRFPKRGDSWGNIASAISAAPVWRRSGPPPSCHGAACPSAGRVREAVLGWGSGFLVRLKAFVSRPCFLSLFSTSKCQAVCGEIQPWQKNQSSSDNFLFEEGGWREACRHGYERQIGEIFYNVVPERPGSQSQVLKVTSDLRQCTGNPNGWKHQESYKCHISDIPSDERGLTKLPDIWLLDSWENIPKKKN